MKPLIILISVFLAMLIIMKMTTKQYEFSLSAIIAMCAMLLFTAIGHFAFTKGMSMMIPDFIPFKTETVYLTGILEIASGICLVIPFTRVYAAWALIIFFVILIPANIKASIDKLNYQTGAFDGNGLIYLWFRIPLQLFFIVWIYLSAIKL